MYTENSTNNYNHLLKQGKSLVKGARNLEKIFYPVQEKKMFAQKRGKQFYLVQENIIGAGAPQIKGAGEPTWAPLEWLG